MSDNYKVIRRTREAVKDLKSEGMTVTSIAKHIGIAVSIISDITELDEVAMNLREPTIEKFRKFLSKREQAKKLRKKMEKQPPEPEKESDPGPEPITGEEEYGFVPAYPNGTINFESITIATNLNGLLDALTILSKKFADKGYRLDASLTLQHEPKPE